MQQHIQIVGVDVSKAELVTAIDGAPPVRQTVSNRASAIQAWLATLPAGSVVAMEATGIHHQLLAALAHAAGMRVYVLNARDVYYYARAVSGRGKTDRLDADVIARYAAEHCGRLHAWRPAAGVTQQLQQLLQRRAEVTRLLVSLRQTLSDVPTLHDAGRCLQQQFDAFLHELDDQLMRLVEREDELAQGVQRLQTIDGVGPQGSVMLAALFTRIEFDNADAVVAYSGLDPRACDSGTKHGRRRLSKRGPGWLRRQVYLMALGASRSQALKPLYQAIKARGFAPTPALIILGRKLLRVAWAMWKSKQPFDPSRLLAKLR